ncbi:unnamed protein product [Rhizoctonia solani]|uniref:C2H2-type domain-containing protein n=2 Tax=Rhizoctonia solani TaxID=456999 RepID=A0A8H3CLA3_9AGAM|nr:zinc finger, C2H2 type protein [Rhizoctonia solani AG-3 Rhs1AP]CAE6442061.1 unnamed protein product [Rhizoctonia solani]CAE6486937.1 unnamed protein product [Rhizoctonia solani]
MIPKEEHVDENIRLEVGKKEDEPKRLWVKTDNAELQHDEDNEVSSPSESTSSTPDTPACKGYLIESDFVKEFLGECYYFVAPIQSEQGLPEFAVFSLSPDHRMVSLVDANLSFHHYHIDRSFGPIVYFMVGNLRYQWDIQHGTLSTPPSDQLEADPSILGLNLSIVQLYKNVGEAKALVDSLQYVNLPTLANLSLESPPLTSSNTSSPPNIADIAPTFTGARLFDSSLKMGYFEPSPSQEKIDRWVDDSAKADQAVRDGAHLRCPEEGCNASSRRPHALKTHLYTHYRIKPYTCTMCDISVLTEANLARHMKNAHICPGCHIVQSIPVTKAHKAICPRIATISSARKAVKQGRVRKFSGRGIACDFSS